ncbi:MAG: AmmeMemoRadiSam system radical SAM enzyme [Candidatus Micrarchaeota archaeon]|nr:AmmeMemoRadiSam system radical SAM enzyme [Candidatus Micrarchaeota archaeon]
MEKEALLWVKLKDNKVMCHLCNHYCIIEENKAGYCLVRKNINGTLYSLNYGKAYGLAIDPIEKKPFFHFKPSTRVMSFGTPGCNFRCLNCQNWDLSQAVREFEDPFGVTDLLPSQIVSAAVNYQCDGYSYTYSEPTIFFEYARDVILEAKKVHKKAYHVFVSNGFFSQKMLELVLKERLLDAIRIDLKFIDDKKYNEITGGKLKPVLDNIKRVYESGLHLEVINLVIPSLNDSEQDITETVLAVKRVSSRIPIHFSAFHPDYKLMHLPRTPLETLLKAKKIAEDLGMEYVYVGNVHYYDGLEDTYCPSCKSLLIKRSGFNVVKNVFSNNKGIQISENKKPLCPKCGHEINMVL